MLTISLPFLCMDRNYCKQSMPIENDNDVVIPDLFYDDVTTLQQHEKETQEAYNLRSCPAYDTVSAQTQL